MPLVSLVLIPAFLAAHDVPDEIVVQAFVKPEGDRAHLLVRLPLVLLLDLNLPKHGPGYLDLANIDGALEQAAAATAKELVLFENGRRLLHRSATTRISLPWDKSFSGYAAAGAHIRGSRLPVDTLLFWNQGFFDAHLEYPIASDQSAFSLHVVLGQTLGERLKTIVRFLPPDGSIRAYQLVGDAGRVALDPRWHQAGWTFVKSGFEHILTGWDHLLFLLCLVIPFRRFRSLVVVVTSFTLAHSMTLIGSVYGWVPRGDWFPSLVETLIAASIIYMALENVLKANLARRWFVTFAFGLVHGFGFSFALQESLQFAGSHLFLSLLSFNLGVEMGQVLALTILVPGLVLFFRYVLPERAGTIVLSVIVAHTAWHWMTERAGELSRYEIPAPNPGLVVALAGGILALSIVSAGLWLLARRWEEGRVLRWPKSV